MNREFGRSGSILFGGDSNDHVVHDGHGEHGITLCDGVSR